MFLVRGGGSPVLPDGLNWLSLPRYTRASSLLGTFISKFDGYSRGEAIFQGEMLLNNLLTTYM